ncbi:MAG: tetratricopeptide repeat protein, partial [Planctomycetota bacterium]|nr:tetratricopeptide repeat protein [Planctomycetota bacterium]
VSRPSHGLAVLILAFVGLSGCGEAAEPQPQTRSSVTANDRDASLAAIDRWLQAGETGKAESIARVLRARLPEDPHVAMALARTLLSRSGEVESGSVAGDAARRNLATEAAELLGPVHLDRAGSGVDPRASRRALGLALEASGRLDQAMAVYAEAELADDPVAGFHLGLALLQSERHTEAQAVLEEVAILRPQDAFVRAAVAECLLADGDPEAARSMVDTAVALDGDAWAIRVRRASIYRRGGDPRAAVESLLALDAETRNQSAVIEELVAGWLALESPVRAAETWAEFARRSRDRPQVAFAACLEAARCHALGGRDDDADAWLAIAADTLPEDPRLARATAEIADIRAARPRP